jgi:hypothetical protein
MNVGPAVVVALAAWCDLDPQGEDSGGSAGASFKVREFALLSDGREVTLLDDRGWSTSARLDQILIPQFVRDVHTTVLPDDAEETGEEHEWQVFQQRLREAGVAVTLEELRALPYRVILDDRLRARLGQPSQVRSRVRMSAQSRSCNASWRSALSLGSCIND